MINIEDEMRGLIDNCLADGAPCMVGTASRDRDKRINWRFYGTATIHEVDAVREDVMSRTVQAELDRDPDRQGVAVVVRLNQIAELSGNVLQSRD